jgi:hypothetical protein
VPFTIQTQEQDLWCWAAVAASIDDYFARGASMTQSGVANKVLKRGDCTANNRACNVVATLQDALLEVSHLDGFVTRRLEFSEIKEQIDKKRPVCVRIGWFEGGGHFVVISGYSISESGTEMLTIRDPWYVDSILTFEDFGSAYLLGEGSWTDSFRVK